MEILVSVIMPYYEKKNFFSKSINSVLNQTYINIEVIVVYDSEDKNDLEHIKSMILGN